MVGIQTHQSDSTGLAVEKNNISVFHWVLTQIDSKPEYSLVSTNPFISLVRPEPLFGLVVESITFFF